MILIGLALVLHACGAQHRLGAAHVEATVSPQLLWRAPTPNTGRQDVFADWYDDGLFERWHSCAAVRDAIRHLPVDGPIYSTIGIDLKRYAATVC